jgi:hypothetical protein
MDLLLHMIKSLLKLMDLLAKLLVKLIHSIALQLNNMQQVPILLKK